MRAQARTARRRGRTLAPELHLNSSRHLAISSQGILGFAMQWQGDPGADLPLLGLYEPGTPPDLLAEGDPRLRNMRGYGGSVAFSPDGLTIGVTSPRGGVVQVMETRSGHIIKEHALRDVCGLATARSGFIASTGLGAIAALTGHTAKQLRHHDLAWDNHLVPLA